MHILIGVALVVGIIVLGYKYINDRNNTDGMS